MQRILVATDRSDTANRAVEWAAELAARYAAELLVLQVVAPEHIVAAVPSASADKELTELAERLAGPRGRARVEYDSNIADAIVEVAREERADTVVVGNVTMRGRTEFLLGSVPNRVSHNAPCTVVIVNTSEDGSAPVTSADRAQDRADPSDALLLARAARITRVVGKYGLRDILERGAAHGAGARAKARRFREALEELGPTFAKLGQILSTRPDLLPDAFVEELSALQDQVTPLSESEVVVVMERELAVPWEDVFASIEPQPLAAGTIAQVHRAVLLGGERVVVKVQRPSAEAEIMQDLGLLERLAEKAAPRPAFRQVVDLPAIIEHLSSSLRRELDFRHEADNIERMRSVLEPFAHLDVPHVYRDLSTAKLLVMHEVQGVPVLQAPAGAARTAAGRELLEAYYQQVLADGFFHADPHPGNLMWSDERIYLLDLGMVGEVDAETRESLMLLLLAFWQEDVAFLADVMVSLSEERLAAGFDETAFREDLGGLVARYRHLSLKDLRLGPLLQQLTELAVRHGVRLPASLALIGKAFGQMQLAAAVLDPSLDPFSVAGAFYLRQLAGELRTGMNPRHLFYEARKFGVRGRHLLEGIERLVGARPGPALQVEMGGIEPLKDAIEVAGRRVAVGLTAATALMATAISASSPRARAWTTPTFGAVGVILTGGLLIDVLRRK